MPTDLLGLINDRFGLANAVIEDAGEGQGQTRRYVVRASDRRYLAKYFGDCSPDGRANVELECRFLAFLHEKGVPVARPITGLDGADLCLFEGRPLVMYEWADGGIEWPAAPDRAQSLGRAVGQMHLAADPFPVDGSERRYDLARLVDRPLELLEPFSPDQATFARLVSLAHELRSRMVEISIEPPFFGPIHGDIHQGNCHFLSDGSLKLFDFALCGVGYRAYDLTGFLWPMRDRTIEDDAMRACCEAFLAGYENVRPLSHAERAAIPAFVQVRSLWELGDWLDTGTGRESPAEAAKMGPYLVKQMERVGGG